MHAKLLQSRLRVPCRASLIAQLVKKKKKKKKICTKWRRLQFNSWVRTIPWRRERLPTVAFLGFSGGSDSKESICNEGDMGLTPGLGRSPVGGHGNPLQYSCLNALDRGAWQAILQGILQAEILEWVTLPSSRGSSQSKDQTCVSYDFCIGRLVPYR